MPEQFLHGVEVVEITDGPRPIRTVKSSVIGLIGTAPKGPVNTPVLIHGNRLLAAETFGSTDPADGFTIPPALDGIFDQAGAMVVVINVLDAAVHAASEPPATFTFDRRGRILLPHRCVTNVVVTHGERILEGQDYRIDADAGLIERLPGGILPADTSLTIGYDRPDPGAVTLSDMVGGVDAVMGNRTGVHALLDAQTTVKVTPRVFCAPGFTHQRPDGAANPVVAEMLGIAERLRAVIIGDGPNTTDAEAITWREDWGREDWGSPRVYGVDPWAQVWNTARDTVITQPASARVAGLIARSDHERGFWWSPSNQVINGIIGTGRPVDFALGDPNSRANHLNAHEVATLIHEDGYRLWGNRSCSDDPKWAFLSVRRVADMLNESLLRAPSLGRRPQPHPHLPRRRGRERQCLYAPVTGPGRHPRGTLLAQPRSQQSRRHRRWQGVLRVRLHAALSGQRLSPSAPIWSMITSSRCWPG